MKKYEYGTLYKHDVEKYMFETDKKCANVKGITLIQALNAMGNDGWSIVHVNEHKTVFLLQREVDEISGKNFIEEPKKSDFDKYDQYVDYYIFKDDDCREKLGQVTKVIVARIVEDKRDAVILVYKDEEGNEGKVFLEDVKNRLCPF